MAVRIEENEPKENSFWWWEPNPDSILCQYLSSSSLGGLKYICEPKRHIFERIFWFISFVICMVGAVLMIRELWEKHHKNPVVVTFSNTERDIGSIPFPAVTICNTSPFERSKVEKHIKQYKESTNPEEKAKALDALRAVNAICQTQKSFLKTMNFAKERGAIFGIPEANEAPSKEIEDNLTQFVMKNSQWCRDLIKLCLWKQKRIPCNKLFRPIITNYGLCCTFNFVPQRTMGRYRSPTAETYTQLTNRWWWSTSDVEEWERWNYVEDGFIIQNKSAKFPYRQQKAGFREGLSVLLDPDPEDSFCPTLDSLGAKILLHAPIESPRVADLGQVIETGKEVFLEIKPEVTIASTKIRPLTAETRKCYFGEDYKLDYYKPYTRDNCMEECFISMLLQKCGCVLYFMPRNSTVRVCKTFENSTDDKCYQEVEEWYNEMSDSGCSHCKFSCNDLIYIPEVTYARLQPKKVLWPLIKNETEKWMNHDLSIVHIFFADDSTVPKIRQKLFETIDLIANTGGLMGLLIGFSAVGIIEIVYFATLRVCCRSARKSNKCGLKKKEKPKMATNFENKIFLRRVNNDMFFDSMIFKTKYLR